MSQLILRASCALFLIIGIFCPRTGVAQQANADWYKRAAPEKCLSYIAWNGDAEQPIEGNSTQAMMADPEVRAFITDLKRRVGLVAPAIMSSEGMAKEKLELLHSLSPKLVNSIFERSGCMFVEEVSVVRDMEEAPKIKVAMLVDLGDEADKFVSQMAEAAGGEGEPTPQVDLAGTKAYRIEVPEMEALYFGNTGQILVVAIGEQTYAGAIERMKGTKMPEWLASLDQRAKSLKHVHSLGFLDMKTVNRSIRKVFGPNANVVGELLGTSNVNKIEMIAGLNEESSVTHVLFDAKELEGVLGLLTKHPVNSELFEDVPADSLGAMAMTLDSDGLLDMIRTLEAMMGGGQSDFGRFKNDFRQNTGVDLEADLIEHLGDSWMLFNGASDGWFSGVTLIGEVTDAKKLTASVEKFFKSVGQQTKQIPASYRPGFFKQAYQGETIYSMTFREVFVETSFCIKQDRIYVGLYPQAVMAAIKQLPSDEVLLDDMQVTKLNESKFLKGPAKLSGLLYSDAKLQAQITYPYLQIIKTSVTTMFRGQMPGGMIALLEGLELPPARTMIRNIKPTMVLVRTNEQGVEIEARQTIPTNSAAIGIPVGIGMLLPAVGQVRTAARETQSMNNLRQFALACLNYESAFSRFPMDGPRTDDEQAFSWRVHILPYIEQNNLYDQIRFDEPWDSDHNKALLAKTPDIFKAPDSNAAEGMTVYRGFKGKGVLGGVNGKGLRFGQMTDGSSNTILIARVPDEMATHWAQPGCLEVDEEVAKKVIGTQGSMLAAFCDGSVHRIPSTIDPEEVVNLLGFNEGSVVNWDKFAPRNIRRQRQEREIEVDKRFILEGKKERF